MASGSENAILSKFETNCDSSDFPGEKIWPMCNSGSKRMLFVLNWPPNKNRIYRILTSKLWEARYRLYQRRSLQVNTRWKALDEIFKIHKPLHRSVSQNFAKFRRTFFWFFLIFSSKFLSFVANFAVSRWNLMKFARNFAKMQPIFQKLAKSLKIWQLEVGKT